MCGIVGVAGEIGEKEKKIFIDLLDICQLRGRDSTGVVAVKNSGEVCWDKEVGRPDRLVDNKFFDKRVMDGLTNVLIGHCRHTTSGAINRTNAHPFDFENVIGVHNGTLSSKWHTGKDAREYNVDSMWLYSRINEVGLHDAIREEVDELGAWALVMWDKEKERLNFLRNERRPLSFCWSKDMKTMFWASESWMLGAVDRAIDTADLDKEGGWTLSLPENTLWSYEISRNAGKVFKAHAPEEIEGKKFPLVHAYQRGPTSHYRGSTGYSNRAKGGGSTNGVVPTPFTAGQPKKSSPQPQENPTDTQPSASTALTVRSKASDGTTGAKPSKNSSTKQSSQPQTCSSTCQTSDKNAISESLKKSLSSLKGTFQVKKSNQEETESPFITIRNIHGQRYITDVLTGVEYSETDFEKITGAECSWCKKPLGDINEVAIFSSPREIVCVSCDHS